MTRTNTFTGSTAGTTCICGVMSFALQIAGYPLYIARRSHRERGATSAVGVMLSPDRVLPR